MARSSIVACASILIGIGVSIAEGDEAKPLAVNPVAPLAVGQPLPSFTATDDAGHPWKSADQIGKKFLVLYFYPGDFTGGCTRQAQAYRDALAKIEQLGAEVVGVSGDDVATHKLFKETYGLKHTLLSDSQGALATLLGLQVKAGSKLKAKGPDGRPLLDRNKNRIEITRAQTLPRWTIVVDRKGQIVSTRSVGKPVTDAEDMQKLLAANQPITRIGAKPTEIAITCFALSPDGDTLVLGSNDGKLRLWSLAAGKVVRSIDTKPEGYTGSVAFSLDGQSLAFHADDGPVRLWDLKNDKETARMTEEFLAVEQLCFAPSGRLVGIVSELEGFIWNLDSGKVWKSPQPVSSLAFSPDAKTLALGFNTLRLADPTTGATIREIGKISGQVTTLQFSPSGDHLLVVDTACPGTTVRLLETDTEEEMILLEKVRSDRAGAGLSRDGKTIVVSGESAQLTFWDALTGQRVESLPGTDRVTNQLLFTPDGKRLLSGRNDSIGDVAVWKVPEILSAERTAR